MEKPTTYFPVTCLLYYLPSPLKRGVLADCTFKIKHPTECSPIELEQFYSLLKTGNKVSLNDLQQKISACEWLGFCYFKKRLIGISAIKRPSKTYIEQVFTKANISRNTDETFLEVGYSVTVEKFRKNGISSLLKKMLLRKIPYLNYRIFSTSAVATSQRFLMSEGFQPYGSPYQGIYDADIIYFEKKMGF